MSWIKSAVVIIVNTFVLLLIVNFVALYFSPKLINKLGGAGVSKLKTEICMRTFAHDDLSLNPKDRKQILVLGDSYSEGMGDEFLLQDSNYGLIRKIDSANTDYIVVGRSGYGTLSAYNESQSCLEYLERWTSWEYSPESIDKVLLMFYEGNDLNNNLEELSSMDFEEEMNFSRKLKLSFPMLLMIQSSMLQAKSRFSLPEVEINSNIVNTTKNGVKIPIAIQSAATELNDEDLELAISVVTEAMELVKHKYPNAHTEILYLPSVATSYEFDQLEISTYQDGPSGITGEQNNERSIKIRSMLREYCLSEGQCNFCDSTEQIKNATSSGLVVHGPLDWKHFNRKGYELVAETYSSCSSNI